MQLFLVGRLYHYSGDKDEVKGAWEFQGVFTSEELAVKACRTDLYFIWKEKLNVILPHETIDSECRYPLHEDKKWSSWRTYFAPTTS